MPCVHLTGRNVQAFGDMAPVRDFRGPALVIAALAVLVGGIHAAFVPSSIRIPFQLGRVGMATCPSRAHLCEAAVATGLGGRMRRGAAVMKAADGGDYTAAQAADKRKNPELYDSSVAAKDQAKAPPGISRPSGTPVRKPEVLSPAGGWPQLRAAVQNGCDAVYFGLDHFNARSVARDRMS